MKTPAKLRIGLHIEKSRAHGRQMLGGIADYALSQPDWRFEEVTTEQLVDPAVISRLDGLIVRVMDDRTAEALLRSKKPVIDSYGRIDHPPFNTIRLDDDAIARMAAACFAEHHFANCAFCGFFGPRFSSAREAGFRKAMAGRDAEVFVYEGDSRAKLHDTFFRNERSDYVPDAAALRKWLRSLPKPVAVFCCNDIRAFQLMMICEDEGIEVPHDVAVLGVDNDLIFCTFTRPPLSSIDTDPFTLGRAAAEMLGGLLDGRAASVRPRIVLHPPRQTIERASTETFPFRTPWLSDAMVMIRRDLRNGITAGDVIKRLGYSHTAVNNAFRAELGRSVQQEIIAQRLKLACKLLRETGLPASRIATMTGFLNPQYFSRTFSALMKATPDVWRRTAGKR